VPSVLLKTLLDIASNVITYAGNFARKHAYTKQGTPRKLNVLYKISFYSQNSILFCPKNGVGSFTFHI